MSTVLIVPSLKISGGVREALRLVEEVAAIGRSAEVLSMWKSRHAMTSQVPIEHLSLWVPNARRALFDLPLLMFRFSRWLKRGTPGLHFGSNYIFTHYSTLPLAFFVPRRQRFFFVQGVEWNFIRNKFVSWLLRKIILGIYGSGKVISANSFLSQQLASAGIGVHVEAPIWADSFFSGPVATRRNIHFAMVMRKGTPKRPDLYMSFIALAKKQGLSVAVITPEDDIANQVRADVSEVLLRPDAADMKSLYARSTCFVHLSETEGFGLPPLEAMGTGCLPICRDSGGVRAFMTNDAMSAYLMPLEMRIEEFFDHARGLAIGATDDQLDELRHAAKACFDTGLEASNAARIGVANAIANTRRQ